MQSDRAMLVPLGGKEYLHIDRAARLERGDVVAFLWDKKVAQMGHLARKPTPYRRFVIDVVEDGKVHRCRMFGPRDENVEIYRVLGRFVMRDI